MFYVIDNRLITICQRFVWHIERFTPREKPNVAKLVTSIHTIFLTLFFALAILVTIEEFSLVSLAVLGFCCYVHFREKEAIKRECVSEGNITRALPSAIRTRYKIRGLALFFALIVPLTMVLTYTEGNVEFKVAFYVLSTLFSSSAIFIAFSEYFMCTISLPPGEKEALTRKRELQNLDPNTSDVFG